MGAITEEALLGRLRELDRDAWQDVYDFIGRLKARRPAAPRRGSAEALMTVFGAWEMTPEERERTTRTLEEERHLEEESA